jgi:hypothetical protein
MKTFPSARARAWSRLAALKIVAAGVVALVISGKYALAAAIGVLAVCGYVVSALNDSARHKPMR